MRVICTSLGLVLAVVACGKGGDGSRSGVDLPDGLAGECGDSAPEILDFTITTADLSETQSWIRLVVDVEDADSDLNYYEMRVWFDDAIDNSIDTSTSYYEIYGTLSEEPCSLPRTTLTMQMAVSGGLPDDRDVEFGVQVFDDMGHSTNGGEPEIVVFHTPAAL